MKHHIKAFLCGLCLAVGAGPFGLAAATFNVSIQGFAYHPDSLTINVGDTVIWTMMDAGTSHTVTSDAPDTTLDSPFLTTTGPVTYTNTFTAAGTFNYHCTVHPFMHGALTVQGAANAAPSVTLTNPAAGASFPAPATFSVQADASDSDGTVTNVEFFANSTSLGSDTTAPFTATANNLPAGSYALTARATDDGGLTTTSAPVNVTVTAGAQPPSVTITNPSSGANFSAPATFLVEAEASDSDGTVTNVEFFANAISVGTDTSAPFSVMANNLAAGGYALTARATDDSGLTTTSAPVNITVTGVTQPPSVSITNPTNGAVFSADASVTIEATANDADGTVAQVEFFDGTNSIGVDPSTPYSVTTTFYPGAHPLTAIATDNQGASTISAEVMITVNSLRITNPIAERIPKGDLTIELQTIADGLAAPIGMTVPDDGSGRMFVYDQAGQIWVVTSAGKLSAPMLDVHDRLVTQGAYDERGLLGLATHPDFAHHPVLYTYTSEPIDGTADFPTVMPEGKSNDHQSVIAEWQIDTANSNLVDMASRREIVRIDEPQANHNAGAMHFGPDGFLYVTLGDGGQANDVADGHVPGGNAQDINRILGKMIRLDVDGNNSANGQYGVPADNPFVGADGLDEVYAFGLRNPFSFTFDRLTGDIHLADAGQNNIEEVDVIVKGGNYGWNVKEGTFWFDSVASDPNFGQVVTEPVRPVPPDLVDPIAEYDHDDGEVVISGYVYRGSQISALAGRYVFADWGSFGAPSGRLFYLDADSNIKEFHIGLDDRPLGRWVRGFGEDANGELYVFGSRLLGPAGNTGTMLKIVPVPLPIQVTTVENEGGTNFSPYWIGGAGPFVLQKRNAVTDPTWMNVDFTDEPEADAPLEGKAGFFRVFDTAHEPPIPLTVYMSGGLETTPGSTDAGGSGTFSLDGNTLHFDIEYHGLSGVATAAHIHGPATTTNDAPVLISLVPFNGGAFGTNGTLSGTIVLTAAQKAMILAGQTYVNVHTASHPSGEVRGQIAPVMMQATISGANVTPNPVQTGGSGLGSFALVGNQLTFNITYRGLSGVATAAHIHGPATASQNAGILVSLVPFNGGAFGSNGTLSGSVALTLDQLKPIIDGLTYVNIHTPNHPGGEIRGQVLPQVTAVPLTAALNGEAERPNPVTTTGSGHGIFGLEGNLLTFNIAYSNLSSVATAAHIHGPASTAAAAGIQVSLVPFNGGSFGTSGTLSGVVALTPDQRNMLLGGQSYVNIHTGNHPGGEIRGQIVPVLMSASLSGVNERPAAIATTGHGSGTFTLVGNQLSLNVTYGGLLSPATASHIHGPASLFSSAGILVNLAPYNGGNYGASGSLAGTTTLVTSNLLSVIDGATYVNVHTTNNPSGEIRGQITR